jgi:hypothetical protein
MKAVIIAQFSISLAIIAVALWKSLRAGDPFAGEIIILLCGGFFWFALILLAMLFKIF